MDATTIVKQFSQRSSFMRMPKSGDTCGDFLNTC